MNAKKTLALSSLGVVLVLGGAFLFRTSASALSRDVPRPTLLPVSSPHVAAEGRVVAYPGAEVVVGTDFPGRLVRVLVDEKSAVRKGDLLAEVDASVEKAALGEARARRAESDADVKLFELEVARVAQLVTSKVGSKQALDKAERDRDAAAARRATSAAEIERLSAFLAKSRIVAPITGVVLARFVSPGETVEKAARLFTVADLERTRIEAEVDEADTRRVRVGAPVLIRAEGEDGSSWRGRVEEIPDGFNPRKLKPQDPGKPSDTRVLLVKVAFSERTPLKLGRRVELEIE